MYYLGCVHDVVADVVVVSGKIQLRRSFFVNAMHSQRLQRSISIGHVAINGCQ